MRKSDIAGIITSILCLIHCSITLVALFIYHLFLDTELAHHDFLHYIFLLPIMVLGFIAFKNKLWGWNIQFIAFLTGCTMLIAAIVIGGIYEEILTILGSLIILFAHVKNLSLSHRISN